MNKSERLQYLIRKGEELKPQDDEKNNLIFAELPVSPVEIAEDVAAMESFVEAKKDEKTSSEFLTSDEV